MTNNTIENKKNYLIHVIYASSFLLAVLAIISYQVWDKYHTAAQRKIEIEHHAKKMLAEKQIKKANTISCAIQASKAYNTSWTTACNEQANKMKIALNNCINESAYRAKILEIPEIPSTKKSAHNYYLSWVAQCKSNYVSNPQSNCALPNSIAKKLDNDFEEYKKTCIELS